MQTRLLSTGEVEYIKKGWGDKPDTKNKSKQFRYECVIQRLINGDPAEFRAEGVADSSNVTGFASDLKLEQMAEARAMRRCLSRAFPVGLASFEDIQEQESLSQISQTDAPNTSDTPLATKISEATSIEELEALKPEIQKSKDGNMIKAYAARSKEIQNAPKKESPKQVNDTTPLDDTEYDFEQEMRSDAAEEKANIESLKQELEEAQENL